MAAIAEQISNLIVPKVFDGYVYQNTTKKTNLLQSAAVVRSPILESKLMSGGDVFTMPFYKDLDRTDSNISGLGDDDSTASTPSKITAGSVQTHRLSRNKSWTATDLSLDLTGADPFRNIGDRVARYWAYEIQKHTLASLQGVMADNYTNNSSDFTMYAGAYTGTAANWAAGTGTWKSYSAGATTFEGSMFIDAKASMTDSMDTLGIIWCHPTVYARMEKKNLITFVPESQASLPRYMYQGFEVIVDASMPTGTSITGAPTSAPSGLCETYILAAGAVRYGIGAAKVPSEVFRNPERSNGGGTETLFSRQEFAINVDGISLDMTYPVGGASIANLKSAANWTRAYPERNQVGIARLLTVEF